MMRSFQRTSLKDAPKRPSRTMGRLIPRRAMHFADTPAAALVLQEPTYSLGRACALAEIDPRRVTNWTQRSKLELGMKVGAKKVMISPMEVFQLAIVAQLIKLTTIEAASVIADRTFKQMQERAETLKLSSVYDFVVWASKRALVIYSSSGDAFGFGIAKDVIEAATSSEYAQPFTYVPVGEIVLRTSVKMHGND